MIVQPRTLVQLQEDAYLTAQKKGWWDEPTNIPEKLALIHSEISEALEDYRDGHMQVTFAGPNNKPTGFPVELADAIIRILDLAAHMDCDLQTVLELKMQYNKTRPYRHGGKRA